MESVRAEKLRIIEMNSIFAALSLIKFYTIIDLPVPVNPVTNTGLLIEVNILRWPEYLIVSIVGTTILRYAY